MDSISLHVQVHLKSIGFVAIGWGMQSTLSIQKISQRSGVAASALRYYEEIGLIAAERSKSGHRKYDRSVLRRLAFIVFAQRLGLTLREVGEELARLPTDRVPTGEDWSELSGR